MVTNICEIFFSTFVFLYALKIKTNTGSPSPRKKRNNSTPVKKNAAEKKQILQQLVSPAAQQAKPKVSLGELISMSENRLRASNVDSESDMKETTFSENTGSLTSATVERAINDPKLEKKVTFARLLNKVSAEMSSGSEVDIGTMAVSLMYFKLSSPDLYTFFYI